MEQTRSYEGTEIAVVVLAAGESRRYGSPKQLADWYGEPLLLSVIRQVEACGCLPYVAIGAYQDLIVKNDLFAPYLDRFIMVEKWASGISASIIASIECLQSQPLRGMLFILGDQPLIATQHIQRILSMALLSPEQTFCTAYNQERTEFGVPAYFPRASFEKLMKLKADQGAKWLLRSERPFVVSIESDLQLEESLLDIDQPVDLLHAKLAYSRNQKNGYDK